MTEPNTPSSNSAFRQLPAQAVHERFATRPALYSVVFKALRSRMLEHYPSLDLDWLAVKLASPQPNGDYTYPALMEVAVAHVLNPQLLDLRAVRERPYFLTTQPPAALKTGDGQPLDMQVVAQILDEFPASLYLYMQHDLADYWSQVDNHGNSRWQWLAEFLNGQMIATAASQSPLSDVQRDMLAVVAAWPAQRERLPRSSPATYVYFIESTLTRLGKTVRVLTPDLLLVRDKQVLLYSVAGAIQAFDSLEAFSQAWGSRMQREFQFDSLTWQRNETAANVFEQQAGLILNQQLEDLAALSFQGQDEKELDQRLDMITNPARYFTDIKLPDTERLGTVSQQLPQWLKQAEPADRFAYHRHLQDMAHALQKNQGRSFNEGIENIHTFSRSALRKQMQTDHGDFDPDAVLLDFAVAAGYPGGAGIIEHVRMSLTELALKNLAGKPKGTLKLSSTTATPLPGWLNEDYLMGSNGLIQRVDIGTTYPNALKDLLLSDTVEARRRELLFTRELKAHLPMQALEFKVRQQHGMTVTGYQYVKALMGETPSLRLVNDQEIVLRPLALCRKAGATPDEVNNMFIIEPRDSQVGPHLLYRPLYAESLNEYPTRQALLEAIAEPGALQDSVLTWLSDKARPIYAHGGIKEPHIIRFLPGDEFNRPEKPAPATLAVDDGAGEWLQSQLNGQLPNHLFGSTARALVDLADRESISNTESRWAIVMEGAWLLFNTLLLPLVQGPAMLAGWFLVLVASLEQDLAGLDSNDPTTRELALIDLLLNTAMVLLHGASPSAKPLSPPSATDSALRLETWRRAPGLPPPQDAPVIRSGAVSLPGEPPASGHTALDFIRSLASPHASERLRAMLDINVPWPEPLPTAQGSGPLKGLYRINGTWHASLGGLLFQVNVVPGFNEVYLVHPQYPQHPGFKLISDHQGHWRLDTHARLEGGMPRERLSKWQKERAEKLGVLKAELQALNAEIFSLIPTSLSLQSTLNAARAQLVEQSKSLRKDWLLLASSANIPKLHAEVLIRHEKRRVAAAQARTQWNIALDNFQQYGREVMTLMKKVEAKTSELMAVDRTDPTYVRERNRASKSNFDFWAGIYESVSQKMADALETDRGETDAELSARASRELPQNISGAYDDYIITKKRQLAALTEMVEPAEKIETLLKEADPALRQILLQGKPSDQNIRSVAIKQHALLVFMDLVFNRMNDSRNPTEFPFVRELTDKRTATSLMAHTEMLTTTGYSAREQIDVLKDVLERYEQLENAVTSLAEMNSGFIREEHRQPFLDYLAYARTSLEAQLANLILVEEGFAPLPTPERITRQKAPNRRVIKTRDRRTLVGEVRPAQRDTPGNFVDIKDPLTGKTLATYLEHPGEGVWNVVEEVGPSAPAPTAIKRSLKTIEAQAQTVRDERTGIDSSIAFQQRKLRDPGRLESLDPLEWDVILTQHAAKFTTLAEELQRDHANDPGARTLIDQYRSLAAEATQQARERCSEGYKLQRPKASHVDYLWKHGFVDINLVKSRVPLKAGDFLTEYAVRDKSKIRAGIKGKDNVLWYAHFHYSAVDQAPSQPDFGHLKTPSEQRYTRRELIEQARADNRAVVNLEKAEIKSPLDQRLFLGLEVLASK